MNNLKRILSLALASVMVLGMMVVGASATSFPDDNDIEHKAAADTMVALGIITGYDDGTFKPEADVTRAQMAKMITVALNGKDPKLGKPTSATFADSANHWALEYIEYCANLGIISGKGPGVFDPEGKVTAAEAAKMILVALGFDADVFKLTGSEWSKNTMSLAQTLKIGSDPKTAKTLNLFSGLTSLSANTPLNRDQAAQLIYNGIQSNTVVMSLTGVTQGSDSGILGTTTGQIPTYKWDLTGDNLLKSKFGAEIVSKVMTKADYTKATKTAAAYWTYTIGDTQYTFANDVSELFMQTARVIYKKLSGGRINVLSITAANDGVMETSAWGDLYSNTAGTTLNGYELGVKTPATTDAPAVYYATIAELPVYNFLGAVVESGLSNEAKKEYAEAQLIDQDGDGRVDCVVVTDVNWTTVGGTRPTYIQLRGVTTNIILADNDVEAGLATGDYVTYTRNPETEVYTVKKAEIVNGTLAATRDETVYNYDSVQVGGSWYSVIENYSTVKTNVGKEVNLVLVAGYVVEGKPVTATSTASDAVMAVAKAAETAENKTTVDGSTKYLEVRVLKADNKTEDLKVTKVNGKAVTKENSGDGSVAIGTLFTYTADSNAAGCVTLTTYAPVIEGDTDATTSLPVTSWDFNAKSGASFTVNGGAIGSYRIAADGTFFVMAGTKYAAVKGSDIAKWYKQGGYAAANSVVYANRSSNGFIYAQEGAIILTGEEAIPGATGQALYNGYVVGNAYYTTENKTPVIAVTVWNGAENVTIKAKTVKVDNVDTAAAYAMTTQFTVGTLVSYLDNGDGTASGLTKLTKNTDAVAAWDGESVIKFINEKSSQELTIDNNTVVLFISGGEGVANGNITMADWVDSWDATQGRYANVVYVKTSAATAANTNDHVDVLVLNTANRINTGDPENPYVILGATAAPSTPEEPEEPTAEQIAAAKAALVAKTNQVLTADTLTGDDFDAAAVKAMLKAVNGLGDEPLANIVLIRFTGEIGKQYTLSVKDSSNNEVSELATTGAALTTVNGIFYFDKTAHELEAGPYTVTVTEKDDTTALFSTNNTFTIAAQ